MNTNELLKSLFSATEKTEQETDYEREKFKKKQKIVRNEFKTTGKYNMPIIKKQNIDLDKIELWNHKKAKADDAENKHKTLHFFAYDWEHESVYDKPDIAMEKLDQYYALLSPDFSLYWNMPLALQIYSTFKNRWCGAYWQSMGKLVIPTVCTGLEESYEFCFDGIEEGCVVAVSTYRREDYKDEFMKGYNKMLEVIRPSAIICYGEPFQEMKGNIKAVDPYNREELIAKLGAKEYARRLADGELYPDV
ncbi:MAG: DUF4417 domain-containing protein [Firmicutes bacterium]|nr:DUF4417 domain-containing protein [Bacillota bacterium]